MRKNTGFYLRIVHRYLGFFLAGIMAMYALSGIVMIFRQTDFLKKEVKIEKQLKPDLLAEELGKQLGKKNFKVQKQEDRIAYFPGGEYNMKTGKANYTVKKLPLVLEKMTQLHKANTKSPIYWLNIFFGMSLLFFVVSAFWMFLPKTSVFKKGLYFTFGGIVLTLILIFF